jgi:L-proline amide hydrolase
VVADRLLLAAVPLRSAPTRLPLHDGPSEFHVVGTLLDWDVTGRLGEINVPTLVVTGEHDEATPAINRTVSEALPGAESVIYPGCSHMAHVEDTEGYLQLLDSFMSRVEVGRFQGSDSARNAVSDPAL